MTATTTPASRELTGQTRLWQPTSDTEGAPAYPERRGAPVRVVRLLTPREADLAETGPMYRVRFLGDDVTTDAFTDELRPVPPYRLPETAAAHTCWDSPAWDGTMQDGCAGCDEAAKHPCDWCGYGHVFTTHNDLAHAENGDPHLAETYDPNPEAWHDRPHLPVEAR